MSGTINKVILIGHTGDDVKMHYFENGNCIGRFPLATNETYTTKSGERVNNVEWHNIVVNNKVAQIFEKYVKKGDRLYIEGRIRTRKWTDNNGIDRYNTEIVCRDFAFLTPKEKGMQESSQTYSSFSVNEPETNYNSDMGEDKVPF